MGGYGKERPGPFLKLHLQARQIIPPGLSLVLHNSATLTHTHDSAIYQRSELILGEESVHVPVGPSPLPFETEERPELEAVLFCLSLVLVQGGNRLFQEEVGNMTVCSCKIGIITTTAQTSAV